MASVTSVVESFSDPAFYATLSDLPNLGTPEVLDHRRGDAEVELQIRYAFAGEVSGAVRAVVDPDHLTWTSFTTIDLERATASFRMLPDHYPKLLECRGGYTFEPRESGSSDSVLQRLEGDIRVRVPLVARPVEKAIVDGLRQHLADEAVALERWLAQSSGGSSTSKSGRASKRGRASKDGKAG